MPYEDNSRYAESREKSVYIFSAERPEQFVTPLSSIEHLYSHHQECIVITGSDFNVDVGRKSTHVNLPSDFCTDNNLFPVRTGSRDPRRATPRRRAAEKLIPPPPPPPANADQRAAVASAAANFSARRREFIGLCKFITFQLMNCKIKL